MKLNLGAEHLYQVPELGHYKYQARGQAGWILAKLSFCVFMVRDETSRLLKIHAAIYIYPVQYPATLTEIAWTIMDLL